MRDKLLADIETALESTQNVAMKEVRGLEERLYGLEQLLFGARKIEQEQGEMAQVNIAITLLCKGKRQ